MIARRLWIIVGFVVLFAAALAADVPVSTWVHDSGLSANLKQHWRWLLKAVRFFGIFPEFTVVAAVILATLGRRWWLAAAFVLTSGVFSGSNTVVKWIVGRRRPYMGSPVFAPHPFVGGLHGLFGPNLSFPSGDVCLAAGTAASLNILFPRYRAAWAAVVILVAIERIAEGAHYPSDTVGGAALGWGGAVLAWRLFGRPTGADPDPETPVVGPGKQHVRPSVLPSAASPHADSLSATAPPADLSTSETDHGGRLES